MPEGKDRPQATSRASVFVNAYNHMHFNVRKSAVAIDCRVPLPNSEKTAIQPSTGFLLPDHTQNYMCKICDALYLLVSKTKDMKDVPGLW